MAQRKTAVENSGGQDGPGIAQLQMWSEKDRRALAFQE